MKYGDLEKKEKKEHPVRDLLSWHRELFYDRYRSDPAKYTAKDAKHAKDLIAHYGYAGAVEMLERFFRSRNKFVASSGHGLGILAAGTVQNQLIAEASGAAPKDDGLDGLREFVNG